LVQPGAITFRLELAVHVVLSNPLSLDIQIATLINLCQSEYGDLLPANERLSLVRALYEQRPESAVEFALKWLELFPNQAKHRPNTLHHPIENINLLAENLFQIEINKIAGKTHNLTELLETEKVIKDQIYASINNHYVATFSQSHQGKALHEELFELREQITRQNTPEFSSIQRSINQAEFALLLADQGFYEDAIQYLPPHDAPLPDDLRILYSIAKISEKSGNHSHAMDAAARIIELFDHRHPTSLFPVWGDYFSLINLGKLLFDLHKPEHASIIFEHSLKICPNDVTLLELLADSYKQSHKDEQVPEILKILKSLKPDNLEYRRKLAQALENIGEWEASLYEREYIVDTTHDPSKTIPKEDIYSYAKCALNANRLELTLNICNELLSRDQEDSQALIFSGEANMRGGDTDKGIEFLNRATQVSPQSPEAWLALAEAQRNIYPIKSVIDTLITASQAVTNSAHIHFSLGELYLLNDAPTLALPELLTAVNLESENPRFLVNYGRALKLVGNISECRVIFSKVFQIEPGFPGLAQSYAKILVDLGEVQEAIPPLEFLITSKRSHDESIYLDYARCVLSINQLGSNDISPMKALIALNDALQINPDNSEAKALIAETLAAAGDHEMAFQAYREALDTPLIDDQNWLERLSYGFGCVASSIGKYDIAIAALQEACQVNPNNPAIYKELSSAFISADLPEDAIRTARNVLVIDGDNPDSLAWFANQVSNLIRNKKSEITNSQSTLSKTLSVEALNALTRAINLAPTRTDLLIQLGYFQSGLGALAEAQETFTSIASLDFAVTDDLILASDYLSGIGNHPAAIACLEKGIIQDQNQTSRQDRSIYIKLSQEYLENNDPTSAINTLDNAIEIFPGEYSLVSKKIDILLELSQPIEALNCIESMFQANTNEKLDLDLLFLASRINRSIGDFYSAVKYAHKGISLSQEMSGTEDFASLPAHYLILISEVYRALIQPSQAKNIIQPLKTVSRKDFITEHDFLDYLCLDSELSIETGDPVRPEIQDLQLEISNPMFCRLMAIKARLMNKVGNYQQAVQILQIAINNNVKQDYSGNLPGWLVSQIKYLTMNSITEAALDLGLWDHAISGTLRMMESSAGEPLSYLNLAKATVLEAEFYNLCEISDVINHKPSIDAISKESYDQFKKYLENVKSIIEPYKNELTIKNYELTDEQIYRWQARADIAFKQVDEITQDPIDILIHQNTPADAASMIYHLHQIDIQVTHSNSINQIIKIARSFSRNPTVLLHVAMAICEDNPAEAMKSLQVVLEQYPYSKVPVIAFCNVLLAKIAMTLEHYEVAQKSIDIANDIWEDEPGWHILAAQIYKQISDSNSTINHLLEAAKLAPKNISIHIELGNEYYENACDDPHLLQQALKSFETALEIDPKDIYSLVNSANIQCLLNELDKAENNARNALLLAPDRADIYQLLGEIAIRNSDYQGAYQYANNAIQLSPKDPQSTIILARSLSALGRDHEALAKLSTMLAAVPDPKYLYLERVKILQKMSGPAAGLDELQKLVILYPEDFSILNVLAKSYIEVNEVDQAVATAQHALSICSDNTPRSEQANLQLLLGRLFRQNGQVDQSIYHLNQAIQLSPDRLEPYLELGLARKERREYQQAIQIFEQATIIAPDDPRASYQAGLALKESKDYRSSETMLRRAVNLAPHDLNIRRQLAAVVALNLVHNPRTGRN
jgi:tetratricopeptide (TPR) repeat protein